VGGSTESCGAGSLYKEERGERGAGPRRLPASVEWSGSGETAQ
jgi:hypothetical protein